jgi:hypothetical protein
LQLVVSSIDRLQQVVEGGALIHLERALETGAELAQLGCGEIDEASGQENLLIDAG